MENLLIRPYHPNDEEEVVNLWFECSLVTPQNNPRLDIERKLRVNPEWFLVGILEGKIVATCMAGYEGHRGWINYLAVSPLYRRQGIGTLMMNQAEPESRTFSCSYRQSLPDNYCTRTGFLVGSATHYNCYHNPLGIAPDCEFRSVGSGDFPWTQFGNWDLDQVAVFILHNCALSLCGFSGLEECRLDENKVDKLIYYLDIVGYIGIAPISFQLSIPFRRYLQSE